VSKSKHFYNLQQRQTYIDQELQKAIGNGDVSHLNGAGKPLAIDDDVHTPAEMRSAYKILKDNDLQPDWIMLNKDIEKALQVFQQQLSQAWGQFERRQRIAVSPRARRKAEQRWAIQKVQLQDALERLNRKILTYNLKVPPGVAHKTPLNLDREIKRLSD
jgi:hypothetical protein